MDCGNKKVTVDTNRQVLENEAKKGIENISSDVKVDNGIIIPPCFIGEGVQIINSVVGPHVSIGEGTVVSDSVIKNSIIQKDTTIHSAVLKDSMIGNKVHYKGLASDLSIGDYTTVDA